MKSHKWFLQAKLISHKIQDGGGRHSENHTYAHKSAIIAYICTEFDTEAKTGSCSHIYIQLFWWIKMYIFTVKIHIFQKSKMGRPPFWNQLNGNNSAIFKRIRTKFDTETENEVP